MRRRRVLVASLRVLVARLRVVRTIAEGTPISCVGTPAQTQIGFAAPDVTWGGRKRAHD